MSIEFNYGNASASFAIGDLNETLINIIRARAAEQNSPVSYLVYADEILFEDCEIENDVVVVAALPGIASHEVEFADLDVGASVETQLDGIRTACVMLAKSKIALTETAARLSGVYGHSHLPVIWLFNDGVALCKYHLSDDVLDELSIVGRVADEHVHLTKEETAAWQKVAREAEHIGVFKMFDLTQEEPLVSGSVVDCQPFNAE